MGTEQSSREAEDQKGMLRNKAQLTTRSGESPSPNGHHANHLDYKGKDKHMTESASDSTREPSASSRRQPDASSQDVNAAVDDQTKPSISDFASSEDEEDIEDEQDDEQWNDVEEDGDIDEEGDDDDDDDDEDDDDDDNDDDGNDSSAPARQNLFFQGFATRGIRKQLEAALQSLKDPAMQLFALQELSEILSVSNHDILDGVSSTVDSIVKELINIIRGSTVFEDDLMAALALSSGLGGGNPEVTLLACRCISNLLDAMPSAVARVVYYDGIAVLCQTLKSMEYIDLAEQALLALEKISEKLPRVVVREGGLGAALMYFDFFGHHSQRTALRTAANCLHHADTETFPQVLEVVPTLMSTITYPDHSVVEQTCRCWSRLAESYRKNQDLIEQAISIDLLRTIVSLIPNAVSTATFKDLLRILRIVSKVSPSLAFELLNLDIVSIFYKVLTGNHVEGTMSKQSVAHIKLDPKWREMTPAIMEIMVDMLPSPTETVYRSSRSRGSSTRSVTSRPVDPRIELLQENAALLERAGRVSIPLLLSIVISTVDSRIEYLVTQMFVKIVHFSKIDTLRSTLKDIPMSSYLAVVLAQQKHKKLVINALILAELLIKKLPDEYYYLFAREGILHEVKLLADNSEAHDAQTSLDGDSDTNDKTKSDDRTSDNPQENASGSLSPTDNTEPSLPSPQDIVTSDKDRKQLDNARRHCHIHSLAKSFCFEYQRLESPEAKRLPSFLDELQGYARQIKEDDDPRDPTLRHTLMCLAACLEESSIVITSFELFHSGLMDALLAYLSGDAGFRCSLEDRRDIFRQVFLQRHPDESPLLRTLVMRLQELVNHHEHLEVVVPLPSRTASSSNNPIHMLTKQLHIKLTAKRSDIPDELDSLTDSITVSTPAIATLRDLEDYLLTRIPSPSTFLRKLRRAKNRVASRSDSQEPNTDDAQPTADSGSTDTASDDNQASDSGSSSFATRPDGDGQWRINFTCGGAHIPRESTVYGAIHHYNMQNKSHAMLNGNEWDKYHSIVYERVWQADTTTNTLDNTQPAPCKDPMKRPKGFEEDTVICKAIQLLKALNEVDKTTSTDFLNRNLTAKMDRQLGELLIVSSACLPDWVFWLMEEAPFLFPFETRYLFVQHTSFGNTRLIARWKSLQTRSRSNRQSSRDEEQHLFHHMPPKKVQVDRLKILHSATRALEMFGSAEQLLEVVFKDEEGTGLGPTLEFYAATSCEFRRKSNQLWHDDGSNLDNEYFDSKHGLFPRPIIASSDSPAAAKKAVGLFKTLGQFVAKAMVDFRIIDIPFNPAFFDVVLHKTTPRAAVVAAIDPVLGQSIRHLQQYVDKKKIIYANSTIPHADMMTAVRRIEVDGTRLDELCLDFTLPGREQCALKKGGSDIPVTIQNVEEYIGLLVDAIAGSGIERQVAAFREGFSDILPLEDLRILSSDELVAWFGTAKEDWSFSTLLDAIKADHGYTMESEVVKHFLQILSTFSKDEQREFLQFTTGSPRLPMGGWRAMRPVFTVVRKESEGSLKPDDYLPSVMTCANYLKMPAYSSLQVMRERLLTSMKEGKNSFLLS